MSKPRRLSSQPSFSHAALVVALALILAAAAGAQRIDQSRGVDSRVDYASLTRFGPWDDRNYQLTLEDLELLAPDEEEQSEAIPAFYRVHLRKTRPDMRRSGPGQYPRSGLPMFRLEYGGYLIGGKVYTHATRQDGRFVVDGAGVDAETFFARKALDGEARVTSPNGAAESAIALHPSNTNLVIAGSNGPGTGQKMHYSNDGGTTWHAAAALPLGGHCCDPTVAWSSDGAKAYTATLGNAVWFYRSGDDGHTWDDLGADPRRELGSNVDKEYLHVDHSPTSPYRDNIYLTWHQNNVMKFARSTNRGSSWSSPLTVSGSGELGIGSDITTDPSGNVYYFWPAFDSREILVRKSVDGGASFQPTVTVASTSASYDFPVPSMESRRVFVYVSADADRSGGPYHGSVYAAWTDSTAATGNNPTNNHARIRVAYSRNGGASWTVRTPHETADANSVDRWHQWLAVAPNGSVHVIFYDTRRDPSRASVDLFHSSSADGGQTWSAPLRLTSAQSPNINDSFEFGDYNGLDVVMNDLIAIYTDNRREGGGSGDSVDVYAVGTSVGGGGNAAPQVTITAPADGSSFPQGTAIGFAGTATDQEDGNLTAGLAWTSSRDGVIGSGGSFSATLSTGTHTVTAAVTDSGGLHGSSSITVTVTGTSTCGGYHEDFEGGAGGWSTSGLWHLVDDSPCANPGYSSPTHAMYYGRDASCDFDTGATNSGRLTSPVIDGITAGSRLSFRYFREVEETADPIVDRTRVRVRPVGGSWKILWSRDSRHASENAWTASGELPLGNYAGQSIQLQFLFQSIDEIYNDFTGWLIDDVEVNDGSSCGAAGVEVGRVQVKHKWKTVSFAQSFTDPVVVAKPASYNGNQPGVVRLRNVTPASFQLRIQEWNYLDGNHANETVSYLIAERGRQALPGGGEIEAGSLVTDHSRPGSDPYAAVTFSQPFAAPPLVLAVVGTYSGSDAVATRQQHVTTTGFEVILQEEESLGGHTAETIYWIAWTPGSGTIDGATLFEAGRKTGVRHQFSSIGFQSAFAGAPCFLADMQTAAGGDPANLRYRNLNSAGVEVQVDEEQSADSETKHTRETVGYLAFACD